MRQPFRVAPSIRSTDFARSGERERADSSCLPVKAEQDPALKIDYKVEFELD